MIVSVPVQGFRFQREMLEEHGRESERPWSSTEELVYPDLILSAQTVSCTWSPSHPITSLLLGHDFIFNDHSIWHQLISMAFVGKKTIIDYHFTTVCKFRTIIHFRSPGTFGSNLPHMNGGETSADSIT